MSIDQTLWTRTDTRAIVKDELRLYLAGTGGALTRERARVYADLAGWRSLTPIYRLRREILAEGSGSEDEGGDLLERLALRGPGAFVLDDVFWTLYFWLGSQKRVLAALSEVLGADRVPSRATLCRKLKAAPALLQAAPRSGLREVPARCLFVRGPHYEVGEAYQADEVVMDLDAGGDPGTHVRIQVRVLLLTDVASGFKRAVSILPRPFTSGDFLALLADAAEPLVDADGRAYGRLPDSIVFDNARAFTATRNDDAFVRVHRLAGLTPGCFVSLPQMSAHAPYAWWGKAVVEAEARHLQDELLAGLPGRRTNALRLDGTDLHGQPDAHLLTFEMVKGLVLLAVDRRNDTPRKHLGTTPREFFMANAPAYRRLPDEALAELYQPHAFNGGRRRVEHRGVCIDGRYWVGDGVDVDFDEGEWRRGQKTKPTVGDFVEVRVLNHLTDPLAYLPPLLDGSQARWPTVPEPLRRRYDRAAVFFGGRFCGWVYDGPTPAGVRERIVDNRSRQMDYVMALGRAARQAAQTLGADIAEGRGMGIVQALRESRPGEAAPPKGVAVGQDPATPDDPHRPGRRPPTRRRARGDGGRVPARKGGSWALDALADAAGADDDEPDEDDG
ncbi:MAG: hypothetical protein JO086_07175 [Acidimicrobiia bacterium]|nr:hypothetical protein [Acidimicrobiia bacterium]